MVNPGLVSGSKPVNSVKISFRLPYFTQWGQSLLVCGSVPVLGSWNVKKGVLLSPFHEGSELIWSGSITVPKGFQCQYTYYVVDDKKNIVRWEMGKKHELTLPESVQSGQEIEFRDLWQVASFFFFHISLCRFQVSNNSI
jgi:4-alpha-glucanotransferase